MEPGTWIAPIRALDLADVAGVGLVLVAVTYRRRVSAAIRAILLLLVAFVAVEVTEDLVRGYGSWSATIASVGVTLSIAAVMWFDYPSAAAPTGR